MVKSVRLLFQRANYSMVEIWDNFERVFELMDAVVEIDGEEMFAIEVRGERLLT
jgi:hypothetical protein